AQKSAAFGAPQRSLAESALEASFVQRKKFEQAGRVQVAARVRGHQTCFAGEAVPRAGLEAIVAAEDSRAEQWAQFDGDAAVEFDGEVGDTAAGVELERRRNRIGRASRDATGTGAATVFLRRVRLQFQRGEDFRQVKPVAELAADQVGVLADEAQSGPLRQVPFEHWPGVHVPERARARTAEVVDEGGQLLERCGEDVVIVGEAGVAGDDATSSEFRVSSSGLVRGRTRNPELGTWNRAV